MAYNKTIWANAPATTSPINQINLNNMETGIFNNDAYISLLQTGWNSAGETWTYASVDDPTGVITITGDKTGKYSLGMRIKFTNATNVIYGIITAISYTSPNTTLTFLHEIDPADSLALHLMANSAITANYYSNMKAPFGFPLSPDKWSVSFNDTADRTQSNPVATTWYNLNSNQLSIPIGLWQVHYELFLGAFANAGISIVTGYSTLSTANNTQSDASMTYPMYLTYSGTGVNPVVSANARKEKLLILSSKTIYFLNVRTSVANILQIQELGSFVTTTIKATCAYL